MIRLQRGHQWGAFHAGSGNVQMREYCRCEINDPNHVFPAFRCLEVGGLEVGGLEAGGLEAGGPEAGPVDQQYGRLFPNSQPAMLAAAQAVGFVHRGFAASERPGTPNAFMPSSDRIETANVRS